MHDATKTMHNQGQAWSNLTYVNKPNLVKYTPLQGTSDPSANMGLSKESLDSWSWGRGLNSLQPIITIH